MKYEQGDAYCYKDTDILENIPSIMEQDALDDFEEEHSSVRMLDVPTGNFDAVHLCAVHKHIFQDVYTWAGEFRNCSMSKGGSQFCQPQFIAQEVSRVCQHIKNNLKQTALSDKDAISLLVFTVAEFNAIHPFREGNGRVIREFASQLAEHMGYFLDITRLQDGWLEASIDSFSENETPLKILIAKAIQSL